MTSEILRWVKIVVLKTLKDKRLTHLDIDTLISAGQLGYVQSLRRFDPTRNIKFKTFAEYRIKGAVLDEVRKMIGDERCKNPRPYRVDDFDTETIGDERRMQYRMESHLDIERFYDRMPISPENAEILRCRIEGMTLKEIGDKHNLGESRVSQLLKDIKIQISPWFKDYMDANFSFVSHECPECHYRNDTFQFINKLECEKCGTNFRIVDDKPVLGWAEE